MWKIIKLGTAYFLFFSIFNIFAESTHLQLLNEKFPSSLLGDDYGILNEDDLATNACIAWPSPFSLKSTSFPYWQCFEKKKVRLFCDGHGYDEDEKDFLTVLVMSQEVSQNTLRKRGGNPFFYGPLINLKQKKGVLLILKGLVV